jgi:hypothetical protein
LGGEGGGGGSYEFGCVCVPVFSMHTNAGAFLSLQTSVDKCL